MTSEKSAKETSSIFETAQQPGEFGHAEPHCLQCQDWTSAICATMQVTGLA
jgi:hypothetical protein